MDCHSSLQAVNQEPYSGPTQMNQDNAPLSPLETFENFNPMQPFFQEDYPSQRFRPQKHELFEEQKCDVYDPYYSPPETFMPSESSDAMSVELPKTNTSQSVERLVSQYYINLIYNTNFQQRSRGSHRQTNLLKAAVPKWNSKLQRP